MKRCSNCSSKFHQSDKCDRSPTCVSCSPGSNHPSTSPNCPTFLRKCNALDRHFPENTMPYFPSRDSWTWAASPANPPPPPQMTASPSFQQASTNQHSIQPQRQRPCHGVVTFEDPQAAAPQTQTHQTDNGWSTVHPCQLSPPQHRQTTITDIWGPQQAPLTDDNHARDHPHRSTQ